jgi:DsbC/DsbD-like thiol-disulfide interchange protein
VTGARGFSLAACLLAVASVGRAQEPLVQVRAIPEYAIAHPGTPFRVAVEAEVPAGWHIYWTNPGVTGLPTTLTWNLPEGVHGGATAWPYPETDDEADGVANVYRGTVVLFSSFTADSHLPGPVRLSADLVVGLCRIQCVRQVRTVSLELPVRRRTGVERSAAWSAVALAERAVPIEVGDGRARASARGDSVRLVLGDLPITPPPGSWVTFFPLESGKASAVVQVRADGDHAAVILPAAAATASPSQRLTGVLVPAHPAGVPPASRPFAVDVPVTR